MCSAATSRQLSSARKLGRAIIDDYTRLHQRVVAKERTGRGKTWQRSCRISAACTRDLLPVRGERVHICMRTPDPVCTTYTERMFYAHASGVLKRMHSCRWGVLESPVPLIPLRI